MTNPAEVITATLGGRTFRCSRRTAAHIEWTIERLARKHPDARLVIIQGSYNTGVAASAGTHDYDGVIDCWIEGLGPFDQQRFLRESGWAAWFRQPPLFSNHIHAVSLGCPGPVGVYVPGQVDDYYAHRTGLAGHAPDPTWHPANIGSTIFDYPAWVEAHMPLNADDLTAIRSLVHDEIAKAATTITVTNPSAGDKATWTLDAVLGRLFKRTAP